MADWIEGWAEEVQVTRNPGRPSAIRFNAGFSSLHRQGSGLDLLL